MLVRTMGYDSNDYYTKKAKENNFAARSVFKLEEMDQKYKIFKPQQKVLDLGAAPGSWSQYASQKIKAEGFLLGLDLQKINVKLPNAVFVEADLLKDDLGQICLNLGLKEALFDVVMSDMAPKTTGIKFTDQARSLELCEMALSLSDLYLKKNGTFVCKLFHSEEFKTFQNNMKAKFKRVEVLKPKATRQISKEIFFIGLGKT